MIYAPESILRLLQYLSATVALGPSRSNPRSVVEVVSKLLAREAAAKSFVPWMSTCQRSTISLKYVYQCVIP